MRAQGDENGDSSGNGNGKGMAMGMGTSRGAGEWGGHLERSDCILLNRNVFKSKPQCFSKYLTGEISSKSALFFLNIQDIF
jgi:hypothetical protein